MRQSNGYADFDSSEEMERFLSSAEVEKLSRDLKTASRVLTGVEARYLVDAYYMTQDLRKRFANQERAMGTTGEPHEMISWFTKQMLRLEGQIKLSLDVFSYNHEVGSWLRGNKGIGPVIAAGLLAHIDIHKAKTFGHIWRYAGLDPTVKWYGRGITEVIKKAREEENGDMAALLNLGRVLNVKPTSIMVAAEMMKASDIKTPEEGLAACISYLGRTVEAKAFLHSDNIIEELIPQEKRPDFYRELYGIRKVNWTKVTKAMARRPWNNRLKTLCWKIGDSFKKVSGVGEGKNPSPYGLLYRDRKAKEIAKNDAGDFANTALEILRTKKISETTDAYWWYSGKWVLNPKYNPAVAAAMEAEKQAHAADTRPGAGWKELTDDQLLKRALEKLKPTLQPKLSPGHIDARAMRFAVKIFLSHLHEIMYKRILKKNPPIPYAMAHLNHAHMIEPFHIDGDIIESEVTGEPLA